MPFGRILVAVDGSEASDRAFAKALELARVADAHLTALAIEGPLPAYAATIGEEAEHAGIQLEVDLRRGHAAEVISEVAAAGRYDLVVLGQRGHLLRDHLL